MSTFKLLSYMYVQENSSFLERIGFLGMFLNQNFHLNMPSEFIQQGMGRGKVGGGEGPPCLFPN